MRPSALAVLRLITSSYLVALCTGRSAGFALKDAIHVASSLPVLINRVRSVRDEAAVSDEETGRMGFWIRVLTPAKKSAEPKAPRQ